MLRGLSLALSSLLLLPSAETRLAGDSSRDSCSGDERAAIRRLFRDEINKRRIAAEYVAVPVFTPKGSSLPSEGGLRGWFVKQGEPLSVVAVEHGPADVILVRDLTTEEAIDSSHSALQSLARELAIPLDDLRETAAEVEDDWFFGEARRSESEIVEAFRPIAARIDQDLRTLDIECLYGMG